MVFGARVIVVSKPNDVMHVAACLGHLRPVINVIFVDIGGT